jgi:hypothetical protein
MARDPPPKGAPRKKKEIHPPTGGFHNEESSDNGSSIFDALDRERRYDENQRRLEEEQRLVDAALRAEVAAAEKCVHDLERDPGPEESEEDMKEPVPERNDRAVVIPWYQETLDISEEVAQTLYDEQDLTIPKPWASLNNKSIDTMVKQGQVPIPIRLIDKLKLLAFTCRHAERT